MPSSRLPPKVARFLGMQTATTPVVLFVLWAFCLYETRPNHMGTTGGLDPINTAITWVAFTLVFLALACVNIIFSRQLLGEAKGERRGIETW